MRIFRSADDIKAAVGEVLGTSEPLTIDQDRINQFADATSDHQWIHVDVERAKEGPFGSTIAHGFLTLSLLPHFSWQIFQAEGERMVLNYGLNKVRFIHPVRVGSVLRSTAKADSVTEVEGGVQLVVAHTVTIEVDGEQRPACVAEAVIRFYF